MLFGCNVKETRKRVNKLRWLHTTVSVRPEHCERFPNTHHLRKRWACTESLHKTSLSLLANRRAAAYVKHISIGLKRAALLRRRVALAMLWRRFQDWFMHSFADCTDLNKGIPLQRGLPCSRSTSLPVITFLVWVIQLFVRNELQSTLFKNKTQTWGFLPF